MTTPREAGTRLVIVTDSPYKDMLNMQQPTDVTMWCICEVCGLRIHPIHGYHTTSSGSAPAN